MDIAVRIVIAVVAALVMYLIGVKIVRVMMAPPPPDDPELSLLRPVDYRYRCTVCGTEVTMTAAPAPPDEDGTVVTEPPDAPRHCREDMRLLGVHSTG
jgi:hypothetical protein